MDENERTILLCLIRCAAIFLCVSIISMGGCAAYTNKTFVDGGYEQASTMGQTGYAWVKHAPK